MIIPFAEAPNTLPYRPFNLQLWNDYYFFYYNLLLLLLLLLTRKISPIYRFLSLQLTKMS